MSVFPAVSSRPFPPPAPAAQGDARSGVATAQDGQPDSPFGAVALSQSGIDLSAALTEHAAALGNATIDAAQNLLGSFTRQLLGDAADGATVSFDSASLSVDSGFAATQHRDGPSGTVDAAAFRLSDNSHFIGKGSITTKDGERFEFDIEVQYQARVQGSTTSQGGADASAAAAGKGAGDSAAGATLPTLQLPDVDFAGTLGDLFTLLGQRLRGDVQGAPPADGGKPEGGTLSLRMRNLANNVNQLETSARQVQDDAKARAKMLADAYGAPAATSSASSGSVAPAASGAPHV